MWTNCGRRWSAPSIVLPILGCRALVRVFSRRSPHGHRLPRSAGRKIAPPCLDRWSARARSVAGRAFATLAARHYPEINRDLLLTGAILHDIGKLEELSWGTSFDYTLEGQLVGHITLGVVMIEKTGHPARVSSGAPHVGRAHGSESSWQTGIWFAQAPYDSRSSAVPLPR